MRVTAQLADTKNGGHVWFDRYDFELKDVFALQDELTQSIVGVLQIKLDGEEAALFGIQSTTSKKCTIIYCAALRHTENTRKKPPMKPFCYIKAH